MCVDNEMSLSFGRVMGYVCFIALVVLPGNAKGFSSKAHNFQMRLSQKLLFFSKRQWMGFQPNPQTGNRISTGICVFKNYPLMSLQHSQD